jgi:hypothetical protein
MTIIISIQVKYSTLEEEAHRNRKLQQYLVLLQFPGPLQKMLVRPLLSWEVFSQESECLLSRRREHQ